MDDFKNRGLGLLPSEADPRDYRYGAVYGAETLPESYQMDISGIQVHDQGKYQNCGTHALSACVEIGLKAAGKYQKVSFPWYYGNRRYSDHKGEGTEARGLLKGAQKDGGLYLADYPYEEEIPTAIETFEKNFAKYRSKAQNIRIKNYYQCHTADEVKQALYKGYPVLVGTVVFQSFYEITAQNPIMPEPRIDGISLEPMAGGHMMLIVGWNKTGFTVLNSWGEGFGKKGTFTMPYGIVDWSQRNNFPLPMFEAWAIDGIYLDGKLLDMGKAAVTPETPAGNDGWYKQNGKWRYRENGCDITGWKKVQGVWYYLKPDGYMATGWVKDKDRWYFLKANGAMATGWMHIGGRWYYFLFSGAAAKGFRTIDGKDYYFAESWFEDVKECQLVITDENGTIIVP